MERGAKPIEIPEHAWTRIRDRGATIEEIVEAIRGADWKAAGLGRLECRKSFPFGGAWRGVYYGTKQIRPIFVEEAERIVVVTVYAYYV